jgi:hypothetical protein
LRRAFVKTSILVGLISGKGIFNARSPHSDGTRIPAMLAPARYKGAYGGRGSGKSHFFGELMVEECARQLRKQNEEVAWSAGDDLVRFFHWGNFDKTAICAASVGHNSMIEEKPDV